MIPEATLDADYEFEVSDEQATERLDTLISRFLRQEFEAGRGELNQTRIVPSRSKVAQWISDGYVQVNYQQVTKPSYHPDPGDLIGVRFPAPRALTLEPDSSVPLDIIFEDRHLLVLNKAAGIVVHPGAGQGSSTLVQGLLDYLGDNLRQVGDALRPGIVHRLDKDTSGLMVVAKTDPAYQGLLSQFLPPRTIKRGYLALTCALPQSQGKEVSVGAGVIELPIGRHPVERKKMAVVRRGGRDAYTEWKVVEHLSHGFLLELALHTGRTHQIRVHLQQTRAPIVGDPVYGGYKSSWPVALRHEVKAFGRQALHAYYLSFFHPVTKKNVEFRADMPADMQRLVALFRQRVSA